MPVIAGSEVRLMMSEAQLAQRMGALRQANGVRCKRAEVKRKLSSGELTLEALLEEPPTEVLRATIGEVLEWVPGIGRWRAQRILAPGPRAPGVGRMVAVGHLSPASRQRIVARYEEIRPFRYGHLTA